MYERPDGTICNAAFKDSKGVSVELQCLRSDLDVADHMRNVIGLHGNIAKIPCSICEDSDIGIFNSPSNNEYHRLLLNKFRKNEKDLRLTDIQADDLADSVVRIIH
ncbi:MAG: hypothetical protein MSJ26_02675 [Oscillospiraceae bacterium]|nr:hypothetical protein [Oscillospiraceae bacterium]